MYIHMTCRNHQKMLFSFFTDMVIVILLLHNIWIKTYIIKFLTRKKKKMQKLSFLTKASVRYFYNQGCFQTKMWHRQWFGCPNQVYTKKKICCHKEMLLLISINRGIIKAIVLLISIWRHSFLITILYAFHCCAYVIFIFVLIK